MRNPERIERMIQKLQYIWERVPDWRFGQLMCNLQRMQGGTSDGFYTEDDKWEEVLDKFIDEFLGGKI